MTARNQMFGVVGSVDLAHLRGDDGAAEVTWTVAWAMTSADAKQIRDACVEQQQALVARLQPLHEQVVELNIKIRGYNRAMRYGIRQGDSPAGWLREITRVQRLCDQAIAEHSASMFDPLFPTGLGFEAIRTTLYRILTFEEDPRALEPAEILRRRAELFGGLEAGDDDA